MLFFAIYDTIKTSKNIKKLVKLSESDDTTPTIFDNYISEKYGERRTLDPHELTDFKWYIINEIQKKDASLYGMLFDRFFRSNDDAIGYINMYCLKTNKLLD